ncbi:MAG: carbon starvation CstA family protein [Clostridium sp.]
MENAEGWRKFPTNMYPRSLHLHSAILIQVGYSNIWPLFGSANQLLGALVLITLCVFLKVIGRQNKTPWIVPCVIMLCVTFTALVQRTLALVNAFSAGTAVFMVEGLPADRCDPSYGSRCDCCCYIR